MSKTEDKKIDVIGLGRAVYDYSVLVKSYPGWGEKSEAIDRFEAGGSPVPNALCQLSKWGLSTSLIANVGTDHEGDRFIPDTASYGVSVEKVRRCKGQRTPHAYLWVEERTGQRTIVLDRFIAPLSPDSLPLIELQNCRVLHLDGWETEATLQAARIVRDSGGKVMIDLGNIRPRQDEILNLCDWIIAPCHLRKPSMAKKIFSRSFRISSLTVLQRLLPLQTVLAG